MIRVGSMLPGSLRHVPFRVAIQRASHLRCFPPFDEGRWSFFLDRTGRTLVRDLSDRAAAVGEFDLRPRLPQIESPVLLIRSENEGLVSADCHGELERGLPNATTEMLHSTGHLSYLTHPHRLAKCLRTFIGSQVDSPASESTSHPCSADRATP
jgi:pimeloyl-ACP methyl ester carboxylesterase